MDKVLHRVNGFSVLWVFGFLYPFVGNWGFSSLLLLGKLGHNFRESFRVEEPWPSFVLHNQSLTSKPGGLLSDGRWQESWKTFKSSKVAQWCQPNYPTQLICMARALGCQRLCRLGWNSLLGHLADTKSAHPSLFFPSWIESSNIPWPKPRDLAWALDNKTHCNFTYAAKEMLEGWNCYSLILYLDHIDPLAK